MNQGCLLHLFNWLETLKGSDHLSDGMRFILCKLSYFMVNSLHIIFFATVLSPLTPSLRPGKMYTYTHIRTHTQTDRFLSRYSESRNSKRPLSVAPNMASRPKIKMLQSHSQSFWFSPCMTAFHSQEWCSNWLTTGTGVSQWGREGWGAATGPAAPSPHTHWVTHSSVTNPGEDWVMQSLREKAELLVTQTCGIAMSYRSVWKNCGIA